MVKKKNFIVILSIVLIIVLSGFVVYKYSPFQQTVFPDPPSCTEVDSSSATIYQGEQECTPTPGDFERIDFVVTCGSLTLGTGTPSCSPQYAETSGWIASGASAFCFSVTSNQCCKVSYTIEYCPECDDGDTFCDDPDTYTCDGGEWDSGEEIVGKCGNDCNSDSDCGTNQYTSGNYCYNGNVVKDYITYDCYSDECDEDTTQEIQETCAYGCSNNLCIVGECVNGEISCVSTPGNYRVCEANNWVDYGITIGQCGVNCINGETSCLGIIPKICTNSVWINQDPTIGICGVECIDGTSFICEGTSTSECNSYIWQDMGKIEGQCGYTGKYLLGENELVAMETFTGGATISRTSTRYPIVSFIYILPAVVIDSADDSVTTDRGIYDNLDEGQTLQIPVTQVWSVFYVILNNYQLPTLCDIIDVDTGECTHINPGITTVCSYGTFDPSLGLCVIQPESSIICPEGGVYDVTQDVCIFNPPLQAVCPENSVYNVNSGMCEYTSEEAFCNDGFDYNPTTGKCESYPESQINCPGGYAYDEGTDMCIRYPLEDIICPLGSTFNIDTDSCEYHPIEEYVCQLGFAYNSESGNCELTPAESVLCDIGTYDEVMNLCVYEPALSTVCNPPGILTYFADSESYACIYTPSTIEICPPGSTYNIEIYMCEYIPDNTIICRDDFVYNINTGNCEILSQALCIQGTYDFDKHACVYSPNMEYLCINGEIKYDNDGVASCVVTYEESVICPEGFVFNSDSDKCERHPDYWTTGIMPDDFDIATLWEDYTIYIIIGGILLIVIIIIVIAIVNGRKKKK